MKKSWLPLIIAVTFVAGLWVGKLFLTQKPEVQGDKIEQVMQLIRDNYVEEVNPDSLLELAIPEMLSKLDPHSVYIPKEELQAVNDELGGSFSGVGVQFTIMNDTITVVESIAGGPAEKVGIVAGDRIIQVGDSMAIGWKNQDVFKNLRGAKGSQVQLKVLRHGSQKPLTFTVTRGDIPVNSVIASYMLTPTTGFIKINKFGANTYQEFLTKMFQLQMDGARNYIIDLRGNGGGFMEPAVYMAQEFLPAGAEIVSTKGRLKDANSTAVSDGSGNFQDAGVTVLIDEYSASASEIFAGAIQDNDRGTVVGRRSFGKGLVQNQFELPDSSAIRLTVARYYTPSGRCIQKEYAPGVNYDDDINQRYLHGEFYHADSVRLDKSKAFKTIGGRTVYGGGGIMPDVFVPNDTSNMTSYYMDVFNGGVIEQYAFDYNDRHRNELHGAKTVAQLLKQLPGDEALLEDFAEFARGKGYVPRWYYINISKPLLLERIKGLIASNALGTESFYEVINTFDPTVKQALKTFKR